MSRQVSLEVMWAIRDCRTLNAQEKALLWAIESRGIHYGSWETVAADAGMRRDAYYNWRKSLEAKGALLVTERPGKTTIHEVNAAWFALDTIPANAKNPSGNPAPAVPANANDLCGNPVMKEDYEGDHVSGPSKKRSNLRRIGGPIYIRAVRPEEMNAWDHVAYGEGLDSMSQVERAEWHAMLEAEAYLH